MVIRLEPVFLGFFFACWSLALLYFVGLIPLAGTLEISLYGLYGLAAAAGWLSGNFYIHRSSKLPRALRRRLLVVYLLGPPGILYLLWAMAPPADQLAAPFVPLYAFGVFVIFFLVPVLLRPW